ncbi:MAG: 3-dehydroquinate synthase family protein, partial [Planctomycetota bacterium]
MSDHARVTDRRRAVRVGGTSSYEVAIGPGVSAELGAACAAYDRVVVLADEAVWRLHGARLSLFEDAPRFVCAGHEGSKSLATLGAVLDFLAASGCSRRSCLVAFGGGTITDLGGLAASLFKRGMDVAQVPTTLLAQVDASVGGKTGINLAAGKNLVGTFHQPRAVLADTDVLATLPEAEWRSGLAEIAKAALIAGEADLSALERSAEALA